MDVQQYIHIPDKYVLGNIPLIKKDGNFLDSGYAPGDLLPKSVMTKIDLIWTAVFDDSASNPFIYSFENLDGITLNSGVWNVSSGRLEC